VVVLSNLNAELKDNLARESSQCKDMRRMIDDIQSKKQETELSLTNEKFEKSKVANELEKLQVLNSSSEPDRKCVQGGEQQTGLRKRHRFKGPDQAEGGIGGGKSRNQIVGIRSQQL